MSLDTRANGGSISLPDVYAEEDPTFVRSSDEVGRFDYRYVGTMVALRWAVTAAYVIIGVTGIITVHPLALLGSAAWLVISNLVATWVWREKRPVKWYDRTYLYMDSLAVTFGVLATANLSYPIWLAYLMVISSAAAEQTTRYAAICTFWCVTAYLICAGVMHFADWYDPSIGVLVTSALIMLFIGLSLTITFDGNRRLRAFIRRMSVTDPLTGLANRRKLSMALVGDYRNEPGIAVLVVDVDNFKSYNDSYGHLAGDQLLVRLARTLETEFPDAIIVSRYGGDEFVVLVPCESQEQVAERVNRMIRGRPHDRVPVSAGLAVWPEQEHTLDGAFAAADDCLRTAKSTGKGMLVSANGAARSDTAIF